MQELKIISRNSPLAMAQANFVKEKINVLYPEFKIKIIGITTIGDKILDKALDKIGGKGLFIKELQQQLLDAEADLAVHSFKDVPVIGFSEFVIPAVLQRGDATDCFISNKYNKLEEMPDGAVLGTSSARRIALIKQHYPNLKIKMLRGNVQTRLSKLDNNEYDGIILASAGLIRLNLDNRIKQKLAANFFIPAPGQGAIAIEVLSSRLDLMLLLANLDDNDTFLATGAEREVGRLIGSDCSVPIGVHAYIIGPNMYITAIVANNETGEFCISSCSGIKVNYLSLAKNIVSQLISSGVEKILNRPINNFNAMNTTSYLSDLGDINDIDIILK
ncbi:MAG: hydroxymethylbilane synthase [Proteobacteria bacterium]|nr:hydroxymethylbilane synthase [Pseudomonadota bacterium]